MAGLVTGKKGTQGPPGVPGSPGLNGRDGAVSTVPGLQGVQGPAGPAWTPGLIYPALPVTVPGASGWPLEASAFAVVKAEGSGFSPNENTPSFGFS